MKNEVILNGVDVASVDAELPEGWAATTLEDIGDLHALGEQYPTAVSL
jgi:hypothetical protein